MVQNSLYSHIAEKSWSYSITGVRSDWSYFISIKLYISSFVFPLHCSVKWNFPDFSLSWLYTVYFMSLIQCCILETNIIHVLLNQNSSSSTNSFYNTAEIALILLTWFSQGLAMKYFFAYVRAKPTHWNPYLSGVEGEVLVGQNA